MASDLEQKIIKQMEYYFGDYNLPKDKFLQEKILEDEGWVELSVLFTFKRLANLTTDPEVIVKALEKSDHGIVAVSEDGKKVRRSPEKPLPELTEDRKKEIMNRTAYAKGFPIDEDLDNIIGFLEELGSIESCFKRTYLDKATKEHIFKGSCFIVFKNVEDCKKFIEGESIKYKDTELTRKWQTAYIDEKKQELVNRKNDRKKKKQDDDKPEVPAFTFPKGAFLFFSGVTSDHILTREEIKAKISEVGDTEPSFIDYQKQDESGYIRMPSENGAVEFYKKLTDGLLEIGDIKLTLKVLEGDEEQEYLKKTIDIMSKRRLFQKKGRKNNKYNNKRKAAVDSDTSESKKSKH